MGSLKMLTTREWSYRKSEVYDFDAWEIVAAPAPNQKSQRRSICVVNNETLAAHIVTLQNRSLNNE